MNTSVKILNRIEKQNYQNSNSDKLKPGTIKDLRGIFNREILETYHSEKLLSHIIPKIIRDSSSEELLDSLFAYLDKTNIHIVRLGKILTTINEKTRIYNCVAVKGLISEMKSTMEDNEMGVLRDTCIVLSLQKIIHYNIATYGTLFSFAKTLGENDAANLLFHNLNDETKTDEMLTNIAESTINFLSMVEMFRSK